MSNFRFREAEMKINTYAQMNDQTEMKEEVYKKYNFKHDINEVFQNPPIMSS
eukprot:CAMPEP_0116937452 /NCGR_PEP_ID=MMETSP0467-20121206/31515_1 /TAXON_ID=283647 /ORGANISM="Mesodinium pulex, Strain SPMC105" /LENGTH=51 /DNA_ID=CAMNT_0004619275 /DNA_START=196 /DNA_END=351 /DNA_ORIENTATION=-